MFLSADSDRDEPTSMLCKSASRDGGQFLLELIHSIPIWLGCHLAYKFMLFSVVYSVFVITLQLYLIIYQSMTTIVSLLLFIILFSSSIVMYLHHYLHQVYSEGKCITPVTKFN